MQAGTPDDANDHRSAVSRARGRTSRAILDAAIVTLSQEPGASLGRVAAAAGVGRTTLHRHFPDRATLMRALARDADAQTASAIARSDPDDGPAVEALGRLVYELLLLGDRFTFLLHEPDLAGDPEVRGAEARTTRTLADVIARGQRAGEMRRDLSPDWIAEATGMLVYAAWMAVESGALQRVDAHRSVLAILIEGTGA